MNSVRHVHDQPAGLRPEVLWRPLAVLVAVLVSVRITSAAGPVIGVLIALHAWRGPRQTIEALTILTFLLIHGSAQMSVVRWIVLFSAFGRVLWDTFVQGANVPRTLWPVSVFVVSVGLLSFLASPYPDVSLFKLLSFATGIVTLLCSFHRTQELSDYWYSWFITFSLFIVFASLPLIGSSLGYVKSTGFQGILNHPQTFGPVTSVIAVFLTGQILFRGDRRWFVLVGAIGAWSCVYLSGARTGLLAAALAIVVTAVVAMVIRSDWREAFSAVVFRPATMGLVLVGLFILAARWGDVQAGLSEFLLKDDGLETVSVTGSLQESRGKLIAASMANFREEPLTGIGFGIATNYEYFQPTRGLLGLPVGASIEKGFMPSAVLEEIGLPGAMLTLWLILALVIPLARQPDVTLFAVFLTALFVNLGEMIFFSIGGMGFFFWIMMAFLHSRARVSQEAELAGTVGRSS